jgi:predicted Fe-Mo cluster-binding NifX family protein
MKIAVSVQGKDLTFFGNAGHTPAFAIFEVNGTGMFRSFKLSEIRNNPRDDLDHEHADEDHQCSHDHDDAEHIAQHAKMGHVLEDCDYLVTKRACKNTALAMKNHGIKIVKYDGTATKSDTVLKEISSSFL